MSFAIMTMLILSSAPAHEYRSVKLRAPTSAVLSLFAVHRSLNLVGKCMGPDLNEEMDELYYKLERRFISAAQEAEGVWPEIEGDEIEVLGDQFGPDLPDCDASQVDAAVRDAEAALSAHARLFNELTSHMKSDSAWIGPLRLCRQTVESAARTIEPRDGGPALSIKLMPAAAADLSKMTEVFAQNQTMRLPLRLDGATIALLPVFERNDSGTVRFTTLSDGQGVRLLQRAGTPC